jgi:hypothetical protein
VAKSCWFHDEGLLQLRGLRLGLIQDGDAGVGVFPEGDEIRVRWLGGLPERGWGSQASELGGLAIPGIRDLSTGRRPMGFPSLS